MVRGGSDGVRAKVLAVKVLRKQKGRIKEQKKQKKARMRAAETKGNGKDLETSEKARAAAE